MLENSGNYDVLIGKLDEFIRKYYKNLFIRGLLYATGILVSGFLLAALLEYFGRFDILARTLIFWTFVLSATAVLARFVAVPLFKLNKIGKLISHEQAAEIIGQHFSNVSDKLLNVLQLRKNEPMSGVSKELIEASINQKISELKPVPFSAAIDLRQNRKYAKYALIPLLALVVIMFTNAGIITESAKRLVLHSEYFEEEAPFQFVITNKSLQVPETEDYTLSVKLEGQEIPDAVYILADGNEYKLNKENIISFNYTFRNLQKSKSFRLMADGIQSREYTIEVLPKPLVLNFDVALEYPEYTGRKNETLKNTGDLVVPAGTKISWNFSTKATKSFSFVLSDSAIALKPLAENRFAFKTRVLSGKEYSLVTGNEFVKGKDSIRYSINVIPDLFPQISVEEKKDSVSRLRLYFNGEIRDDYGFSGLTFNYKSINGKDSTGKKESEMVSLKVPFNKSLVRDNFYYYWDLSQLGIDAGEQIEYYFEVWDNDGVHGSKSARTQKMLYKAPTQQELQELNDQNNKSIEEQLEAAITESQTISKDISDLNKKIMEKKQTTWEDKKKLQELTEKQQALQEKIEKLKQQNQQNLQQQQEFQQNDPEVAAKQKEIQDLFDQLKTDEMKKMLDDLQKMLDNVDKNKMQSELDKMKQNNEDVQKNLDRTLELFRQMQFEQKMDNVIKKLDELSKKQDSLSNLSQQKGADEKAIKQAQDSLNKEFDQLRQQMDELDELNQKLENPNELPNTDLKELEIQQQQRESSQSLSQGQGKKASQSQKNASQQMQQLSQQMKEAKEKMQQEQNEEDMNSLRALLDNLIQLSFDQEALMKDVSATSVNDPRYPQLAKRQKKLRDDAQMIEDSLLALSKRNPMISPLVNSEITKINFNMEKSMGALSDRNNGEAQNRQQLAMTSINNLALLLNESLESMMQQMNHQNKSECKGGNCKKPGKGQKNKPGMSSLRQMQQNLNNRMQQMQKGQSGEGGMDPKELAKMAAQQEYIRRMMQEAMKESNDPNGGGKAGGDTPSKMEQTEKDLVNKQITAETMKRQQEILDKLLEYEKAEKQKEMDEKRESNEAKNQQLSNPNGFLEYNRQKEKEAELLKTVPPALTPFYKNKVNIYFNGVQQ
ncbi:MAG: ATPase [Bacteroidia bacterium]